MGFTGSVPMIRESSNAGSNNSKVRDASAGCNVFGDLLVETSLI